MFNLSPRFGPLRITRLVDEGGNVFCPVKARDIDVERCGSCSFLSGFERTEDGSLAEIRCRPTLGTLIAASSR